MKFCTECHQTVIDEAALLCPEGSCHGTLRNEPLLGQRLDGRFVVEAVHCSGGIGVLLRARHVHLGTKVAIKVLDLRDADAEVAADMAVRFRQEATLIAKLRHPAIVEISDFGVADDGRSYIVMEFLEGFDLEEEIRRNAPMDSHRVEWILDQVCDALSWIHSHGVVHRDIKPANIMMTRIGGEECVKLLDFGIAKLLDEGASAVSRTNVVIGTPEYMAPEQIQPALGPIDVATDVYALAVTVYEMIYGTTPFHHDTFLRICQHKLACHYRPLVRAMQDERFESLDRVIRRALDRAPSARHQRIDDFLDDLRQALAPLRQGEAGSPKSGVLERPVIVLGRPAAAARSGLQSTLPDSDRIAPLELSGDHCALCLSPIDPTELVCQLCGAAVVPEGDAFAGQLLGRFYRIEERIRLDDEGLTYRAVDLRRDQLVEVSLTPSGSNAPALLSAEAREALERSVALRSPGLSAVLDRGHDSGLLAGYIVTEWIEGLDLLEEMTICGAVELEVVRARLVSVLETLGHLHREGIVYSGLQPKNVIVASDDERMVLRDVLRARQAIEMSLMVTLGRLGTPQFSAPELLWSDRAATPRADLYSAGALLYFCLTGSPPYQARTAGRVLERMRSGRLVPPTVIAPERATPLWEAVIFRAMSHLPEDRYGSAEEMADALRRLP